MKHHEVIVIGAGHAGVEAAWAAARMGRDVAICTLSMDTIAHMPCNPAIGGTAKGHLVREIDALGGLMGIAIDETAIQFKLLNRSRGPAVWSPRAQADKRVYSAWVRAALEREPNISWIIGKAGRILVEDGRVAGLAMEDGDTYRCDALVVTTGTFLNGLVHVGRDQTAGRARRRAAVARSRRVAEVVRLLMGPAEDRHSAATAPAQHRLLAVRRGARRRSAGAVLVSERRDRSPADRLSPRPHDGARARARARAHRASRRSSTGRSPASVRATARRSRTR